MCDLKPIIYLSLSGMGFYVFAVMWAGFALNDMALPKSVKRTISGPGTGIATASLMLTNLMGLFFQASLGTTYINGSCFAIGWKFYLFYIVFLLLFIIAIAAMVFQLSLIIRHWINMAGGILDEVPGAQYSTVYILSIIVPLALALIIGVTLMILNSRELEFIVCTSLLILLGLCLGVAYSAYAGGYP